MFISKKWRPYRSRGNDSQRNTFYQPRIEFVGDKQQQLLLIDDYDNRIRSERKQACPSASNSNSKLNVVAKRDRSQYSGRGLS